MTKLATTWLITAASFLEPNHSESKHPIFRLSMPAKMTTKTWSLNASNKTRAMDSNSAPQLIHGCRPIRMKSRQNESRFRSNGTIIGLRSVGICFRSQGIKDFHISHFQFTLNFHFILRVLTDNLKYNTCIHIIHLLLLARQQVGMPTSPQLPRLRGSYGETCVMDFG